MQKSILKDLTEINELIGNSMFEKAMECILEIKNKYELSEKDTLIINNVEQIVFKAMDSGEIDNNAVKISILVHSGKMQDALHLLVKEINTSKFFSLQFQSHVSLACKLAVKLKDYDLAGYFCELLVNNFNLYSNFINSEILIYSYDGDISYDDDSQLTPLLFDLDSIVFMLDISSDYCWYNAAVLYLSYFEDRELLSKSLQFLTRMNDVEGINSFNESFGDM